MNRLSTLAELALIVRGADTNRLDLALSRLCNDDLEMLEHGMVMYDALYAWCRQARTRCAAGNP